MSFLDRLADKIKGVQDEMWRDRHPYLSQTRGGKWQLNQGGNGCRPIPVPASVLMEKNPAPLPSAPGSSQKSSGNGSGASGPSTAPVVELTPEAKALLAKHPAPPKAAAPPPAPDCEPPPPFDMLDLPEAIEAMGFTHAAYCARRWFEGKAHTITDKAQNIEDKEFVDTNKFKLSWILKFGNVRDKYEQLLRSGSQFEIGSNVYNKDAKTALLKTLQKSIVSSGYMFTGELNTLTECGGDIQSLHQRFQFQFSAVSMVDVLGGGYKIGSDLAVKGGAVMNDLAASLANFGLYAAVASATIRMEQYMRYDQKPWRSCRRFKAEVTYVYVYAKDTYSFNDKGPSSQYLGHWNKTGTIIAEDAAIADRIKAALPFQFERNNNPLLYLSDIPNKLEKPVDTGSKLKAKEVFYPVRNRHYQQWREIKKRGGDFLIFSDLVRVKLDRPIELDLGEFCWEHKS